MRQVIVAHTICNQRTRHRPSPHFQVHASAPARVDVLLLMGAIHYQLRAYERCVAFNDRCILLEPGLAEAHANLANALQQLGNMDMAIVYYRWAVVFWGEPGVVVERLVGDEGCEAGWLAERRMLPSTRQQLSTAS